MRRLLAPVAAAAVFVLAACGDPTKEEILRKAEGAETVGALRAALGEPDDITKAGPVERWTYAASNGRVVFLVVGETVTFTIAGQE